MDTITAKSANGATDPVPVSALAEDVAAPPAPAVTAEPEAQSEPLTAAASSTGPAVKLNFVNRSNGGPGTQVLVFGKPVTPAADEASSAWLVIQNCAPGWSHPFVWPAAVTIGVIDAWGNVSPQLAIENGQVATVTRTDSGESLQLTDQTTSPEAFGVINQLPQGSVGVTVFRAGKPYVQTRALFPGSQVIFTFKPTIWIGAVSQVREGEPLTSAVVQQVNTEINLIGMAGADIVMTGGGEGPDAKPFVFSLENVTYA
ncbi:hypothetical protein DMC25_07845 [Caulobacter sp. D4A]|uniref:hypothetical protein n=1 Tax=unclassified Caulobacter TaxID=2648921 RepID=UPI000D72A119|nr:MULTISPECIES: hypothetical protein [unclassified Caulobacter]PXA90394.1 hypothetical protein DMC25_07845 [Caulobacter sp. D4A]PXA92747.1 hypothetical protein DMC18_10400 [Caulobacter sp. D5]